MTYKQRKKQSAKHGSQQEARRHSRGQESARCAAHQRAQQSGAGNGVCSRQQSGVRDQQIETGMGHNRRSFIIITSSAIEPKWQFPPAMFGSTKSCRLSPVNTSILLAQRQVSTLYARGKGIFGALSLNNSLRDAPYFEKIPWQSLVSDDHEIVHVCAGWGHSAALTAAGNLYVWGRPYEFATLMRLNNINRMSSFLARMAAKSSNSSIFGASDGNGYFDSPRLMHGKVSSVAASAGLTTFLTEDGIVYCFGLNRWQQCGVTSKAVSSVPRNKSESSDMHIYNPVRVKDLPRCKKIDAGLQHCLALTINGELFSWGKGSKGQLGHIPPTSDPSDITSLPKRISFLDSRGRNIRITDISAGFSHSAAIDENGHVYVWGKGMSDKDKHGASGIGFVRVCEDQFIPRRLILPEDRKASELCSSHFTLVVRADDDTLWTIGLGEHDRNANPIPLMVQNDYRLDSNKSTSNKFATNVYKLRKGFKRVSILSNEMHTNTIMEEEEVQGMSKGPTKTFWNFEQRKKHAKSFDIVVHQGEAYLIGLDLSVISDSVLDRTPLDSRIMDYSSGWQHDLLLVNN